MRLSIGFITARPEPRFDWLFSSLKRQLTPEDDVELILVDFYAQAFDSWTADNVRDRSKKVREANQWIFTIHTPPRPTVWSGPHRITKDNWWSASAFRNTAICWSSGEFFACLDDRCVLGEKWMEAVRDAMKGQYAVCGPYQKRTAVTVENGVIKNAGIVTGEDNRMDYVTKHYRHLRNPYSCPGSWWYGCSTALPMEWALKINGYDELCDGISGEDYIFGNMIQQNDWPIFYDTRMGIVEDRTPEFLGTPMLRRDKGVSPKDKSHGILSRLGSQKKATHPWDIRQIRTDIQRGKPWPEANWPQTDWWDGQQIKDMV